MQVEAGSFRESVSGEDEREKYHARLKPFFWRKGRNDDFWSPVFFSLCTNHRPLPLNPHRSRISSLPKLTRSEEQSREIVDLGKGLLKRKHPDTEDWTSSRAEIVGGSFFFQSPQPIRCRNSRVTVGEFFRSWRGGCRGTLAGRDWLGNPRIPRSRTKTLRAPPRFNGFT